MARERYDSYGRPVRRLVLAVLILLLIALVLVWRIDNPRVERIRAAITDRVVPNMEWAMSPITGMGRMLDEFQSYSRLFEQNQQLRRDLQQMRAWREAALQLEQENARLLDLNRVQLNPELTFVTGIVLADSGSPFRRSVLLNVGARDGILDGWATMDGLGVVGRISGVGERTARVLLLTDSNSRIPVTIQPSGQQALLMGDNSQTPLLDFLEAPEDINAGDRIITSGDGGLFPPGLLVGQVIVTSDRRLRARLAADLARLRFLRVMRSHPGTALDDPGDLIGPPWPLPGQATEAAERLVIDPESVAAEDGAGVSQ
ncbi:Rod shape-determining protein MreC [Roseibacterium elongatum DSM 19469]|uniref:Cell shape-determining protein MreC n=1 Tax=Roseicyclus elongatus DSM 19469 TaxID=1294273 RepID=W8RPA0_9RHOB|nr:rod shape-determining protein MreC [Roseibacterium elongatum]AHM02959.1 Rod shape-determining protein MreC [Roseibacterium elongatum DSM 19469]